MLHLFYKLVLEAPEETFALRAEGFTFTEKVSVREKDSGRKKSRFVVLLLLLSCLAFSYIPWQ